MPFIYVPLLHFRDYCKIVSHTCLLKLYFLTILAIDYEFYIFYTCGGFLWLHFHSSHLPIHLISKSSGNIYALTFEIFNRNVASLPFLIIAGIIIIIDHPQCWAFHRECSSKILLLPMDRRSASYNTTWINFI